MRVRLYTTPCPKLGNAHTHHHFPLRVDGDQVLQVETGNRDTRAELRFTSQIPMHLSDTGIADVIEHLRRRGWRVEDKKLFMADHYRAAADMVVKWAISDSRHCNVEVAEWFSSPEARSRLLELLDLGKPKLSELDRLQKVEAWLSSQ